jgi:hypothetical protein
MPHNGGRSQINFNFLGNGSFPFLNLLKTPSAQWTLADNFGYPAPDTLDANGYPTSISHGGVKVSIFVPTQTTRPGRYAVTWDSAGGTTTIIVQGFPVSGETGSKSTTSSTGRYEFLPSNATTNNFQIGVATTGVSNMKLFHVDDETLINQGKMFGQKFLEIMRQGNCGVFRFLNWQQANQSNVTTWATRKPVDYVYYADEWRSSLYATPSGSPMTNVGNDYSITFGSGGPTDKQTLHVNFNADPTVVSATVTYTSGTPGTVNSVAHPFVNGDPVGLQETSSEPPLLFRSVNYYVVNATANTFQLALTPGGSAIAIGSGGAGTHTVVRLCTISLNGTGAVPIKDPNGFPNTGFSRLAFSLFTSYGTMTYDADLNSWLLYGASPTGIFGLNNAVPIEVLFQLAVELGAHPWFVSPRFVLDPMTDWTARIAAYCIANAPSWMVPRFESVNEITFNSSAGFSTSYAWSKAFAHWGVQFDPVNWQGKISSTLGQALNAAYGGAIDGTRYWAIAGVQTASFTSPGGGSMAAVLSSTKYVAQAAAPQSGYVKEAASNWLTHVCGANYWSPSVYNTATETTLAAAYAGGDLTAAVTYANYSNSQPVSGFNLAYVKRQFQNIYDWAHGVTNRNGYTIRTTCYEGGYSPDINVGETLAKTNLRIASKNVADMSGLFLLEKTRWLVTRMTQWRGTSRRPGSATTAATGPSRCSTT